MEYYFAPMEGVTTHIYRRIHASMFPGCGIYYAPFLVACQGRGFKARELMCLAPENNPGVVLVPQLLSSDPAAFHASARQLADMGFGEVDLNLGCPSGTVVSKHRGSGMLAAPDELDRFLDEVFSGTSTAISVKTRLGLASPEEFAKILEIYNRYPISKLIVHPRVRMDFYNGEPNLAAFRLAYEGSRAPVCYNGNIFSRRGFDRVLSEFPELKAVMLGRGCVADPALIRVLSGGQSLRSDELREFHDALFEAYRAEYSGDKNVLQRMKELWFYMSAMFPDSARQMKRIYKSQRCPDYIAAVDALFGECAFDPSAGFSGRKNSPAF